MSPVDRWKTSEQEREWMLAMHARMRSYSALCGTMVTVVVLAALPWVSALALIPIVATVFAWGLADKIATDRKSTAPIWVAWFFQQTAYAIVATAAGWHGFGVALLLYPLVLAGLYFPPRVAVAGTAYTIALMATISLAYEPALIAAHPPILILSIALAIVITISSASSRGASIEHRGAAIIDPLTGMLNRGALMSKSAELTHQSAFTGQPIGLIVCDIDRFKSINDRFGHSVGDQVLVEFAYCVRRHLRAFDLAYRLGGEEFVVLVPGAGIDETQTLAHRLAHAVRSAPLGDVAVTASFGVAVSEANVTFDFAAIFAAADAALYQAKHEGRDCVRSADGVPRRPDLRAAA